MRYSIEPFDYYDEVHIHAPRWDAQLSDEIGALVELSGQHQRYLLIQLQKVTEIEAEEIPHLLEFHEKMYAQGLSLVFCQANAQCRNLFKDAGADEVLHSTPTREEAVDILSMERLERDLLAGWDDESSLPD